MSAVTRPRVDQPSGGAAAIGISRASGWSPRPGVRWSIRCRRVLRSTLALVVALVAVALLIVPALVALRVLLRRLAVRLPLLLRLVHRVQDTEVMFRVLEERFRRHPVATAGRVAAELEVFFEKLLGGAADADFGPVAVEDVVAIERDSAARMMADGPARSATAATATARAMVAATHALHVHTVAVVLSHCRWTRGSVGRST